MAYNQAKKAVQDPSSTPDQLVNCLIALRDDFGYIQGCIECGRRIDADPDLFKIITLSDILKRQIILRMTSVAEP